MPLFFKTTKPFSSTFQGKLPIFKADWKIKHFSRQHSNSSTFQGLWEPWYSYYQITSSHSVSLSLHYSMPLYIMPSQWVFILLHYAIPLSIIITLLHPTQYTYYYIPPSHIASLWLHYSIPLSIPTITLCHLSEYLFYYIIPSLSVSLLLHHSIPRSIPIITLRHPHSILIITLLYVNQYRYYYKIYNSNSKLFIARVKSTYFANVQK